MPSADISSYGSAEHLPLQVKGLIKNCFCDPNWLSAFEQFSGIKMEPCHQLLKQKEALIGFLPGFIQRDSMCGTLGSRLFGRLNHLPFFHKAGSTKAFVCDSPWGFYSGIECGGNPAPAIHAALIAHIDQIVKDRNLMLSGFTFVSESAHALRNELEANGYRAFPTLPTTFLDIEFASFDEYLTKQFTAKMRANIRRERKRGKVLTYEWFEGDNLDIRFSGQPLHKILFDLHNQTYRKHNFRKTPLKPSFLSELWKMDKQNLRLCITRLKGRVVGFGLLRVLGDTAHSMMVGIDYDCERTIPVYFNTAYYEAIILGISEGWIKIFFRPGVYVAKLRRGFKIENQYLYVKAHSRTTRTLLDIYISRAWKHFHNKFVQPKLLNF